MKAFGPAVLLTALVGVMTYMWGSPSAALNCFLAVGFGVRLDHHIEMRRIAEAERLASLGWQRLRSPARGV